MEGDGIWLEHPLNSTSLAIPGTKRLHVLGMQLEDLNAALSTTISIKSTKNKWVLGQVVTG